MSKGQEYELRKTNAILAINQLTGIDSTQLLIADRQWFAVTRKVLEAIAASDIQDAEVRRWVNNCLSDRKTLFDALIETVFSSLDIWNEFFTKPNTKHIIYRALKTAYGSGIAAKVLQHAKIDLALEKGLPPPPPQFESDEEGESDV